MPNDPIVIADKLIGDLKSLLAGDWENHSAFAQKQARMLATQSFKIGTSRATGSLRTDDEMFEFFLEQLRDKTVNFARTLVALTVLTLEKAWNLLVGALWGAIDDILAAHGLPKINRPLPPAP